MLHLDEIIRSNRGTLQSVESWITLAEWSSPPSIFNYGLPHYVFDLVDKPISNDPIETDHICQFGLEVSKATGRLNYLEIGVSVGKTFFTCASFFRKNIDNVILMGIDIEKINPTLQRNLMKDCVSTHATEFSNTPSSTSVRQQPINIATAFNYATSASIQKVVYFEADEFSNIWKEFTDPFNLVFSDALHDPSALLHEFNQLKTLNLLDTKGFIYCFDDIEADPNGKMRQAVHQIFDTIQKERIYTSLQFMEVNGWLGQHEHKHHFAVIKSIPRGKIL